MWQRAGACRSAAPTSEQKNWRLLSTLVCTKVSSLKQLPPNKKKRGEKKKKWGKNYFNRLFHEAVPCFTLDSSSDKSRTRASTRAQSSCEVFALLIKSIFDSLLLY